MPALRLLAPAKVNLSLDVLGRRDDGYHDVRTVLQAVDLADELTFEPNDGEPNDGEPADGLSLTVEPAGAAPVADNLVLAAARALQDATGTDRGARIKLTKRIPAGAGLGGGSSDAACTLAGLTRLWGLALDEARLTTIAAGLGSDVAFFLRGGTALATGRGEHLTPLPSPAEPFAVLLESTDPPPEPKTAHMYGLLAPEHHSPSAAAAADVERRLAAGAAVATVMANAFDAVAARAYPHHVAQREMFLCDGARGVHLAGAGPALFALFDGWAEAAMVRDRLVFHGYRAHLTRLLPAWTLDGAPA